MLPPRHALRPLLLLLLVLALLSSATWMALRQKLQDDLQMAQADARKNLQVAAAFLASALQDGRYQDIERLLREWGEANRDVLQLKLIAANGFELASYQSPIVSNHSLALHAVIPYSYQSKATLNLTTDLTPIHRSHQRLGIELVAIFALFAAMLAMLALKIVQRRQAQAQLQQLNLDLERRVAERTAELAEKNRELETFTYSVSHDLKAPLRGIDGYSRLLLAEHSQHLNEDGRFFVQTIRNAAEQMGRLIDDLLAYSRLERRSMALAAVDARTIAEALLAERAQELRERGVLVEVRIECAPVQAEQEGLALALRNLLDNALKFTRQVPQPRIQVEGVQVQGHCRLSVTDNGPGFDMQYHERIFDIFQRLHRAEDFPGTGIGLAIVRKSMQRMQGRAWAHSEPGHGATFFLEIPLAQEVA